MSATIGGIKASRWINRLVWARSKKRSGAPGPGIPVKVVAFLNDGEKAVVIPSGHRKREIVVTDTLRPWWSKNPDLKL